MEETDREVSNISIIVPSTDSIIVRQTTTSPSVCVVCGDVAQYSYYGAIVCQSCKIFFRRHVPIQSVKLKCDCGDHCQININNRRICSSCRFAKCFSSGMNAQMIRSCRAKQTNKIPKQTSTVLVRLSESNQSQQIQTLNLLRSDQSTLSVDQWNYLSNLVHCFDEFGGLSFVQNFLDDQSELPPKFRFKHLPVNAFFMSMMSTVQLVFEKNRDFLLLSLNDRNTLLRSTVETTTTIGGAFLLRQVPLFDHPAFFESAELIFRPSAISLIIRLIDQFDSDNVFMKIMFGIIALLTSNYTFYTNTPATKLTDIKTIIRIQDIYTEVVWQYLLYKHDEREAILCFSNFIRCLFLLNDSIVQAHEAKEFTDIIDSIVQSTQKKLTLNA